MKERRKGTWTEGRKGGNNKKGTRRKEKRKEGRK